MSTPTDLDKLTAMQVIWALRAVFPEGAAPNLLRTVVDAPWADMGRTIHHLVERGTLADIGAPGPARYALCRKVSDD